MGYFLSCYDYYFDRKVLDIVITVIVVISFHNFVGVDLLKFSFHLCLEFTIVINIIIVDFKVSACRLGIIGFHFDIIMLVIGFKYLVRDYF